MARTVQGCSGQRAEDSADATDKNQEAFNGCDVYGDWGSIHTPLAILTALPELEGLPKTIC